MERFLNSSLEVKLNLLGRMKSDCEYYLGYGNRCTKYLWSRSEKEHISDMLLLYNSIEDKDKPDWLSLEDIEKYKNQMIKEED